jgi:hypothetical protein
MPTAIQDSGSMEDIISEIKKLDKMKVIVGVVGQADSEIQIIAGVHEFGATIKKTNPETGKTSTWEIPERSYIRTTLDKPSVQDGIQKILENGLEAIMNRTLKADQIANQVGGYVVGQIKNRIVQEDPAFAPLSEEYRKRKKGPGILRESRKLLNSISYEVVQ